MEKFDKKKSIFTYDGKYTYEYFVEGCKTYPTALFWGQIIFIFLILFGINTISALLGNSPVRIYFLENFILLLFLIFVRLLAFNKVNLLSLTFSIIPINFLSSFLITK